MAGRLAIFHPPGRLGVARNPFGKDVANLELWRALARHGGFDRLDVLSLRPGTAEDLKQALFEGRPAATQITSGSILNPAPAAEAGALLRGHPELADLAWQRRRLHGDRAYSLLGLVHTVAPPAIRQMIAAASIAPMHPWDAVICTSPAVQENLKRMFAEWGEHLAERTGGRAPPRPALPVVPLGVDAEAFAAQANRAEARARVRAELGLAEDDVLVLWVGRLSFFEKAFPQPMFKAVQRAAETSGRRLRFVMAGWFPTEGDAERYAAAARAHAPDVPVQMVDGNDRRKLGELWAGADVFLSLVDNIQETFGITPLEAMASGLPVVASDWDGYRFTIRHGIEAFLVPTLGAPAGGGRGLRLAEQHAFGVDTYQVYVGVTAQHTAVHIGKAAEALAELARSPDLRRRMGQAGRERVRTSFDWPVVARQYHSLVDELAQVRAASADPAPSVRSDPVRGDPFRDFAPFATHALTLETRLTPAPGVTADDVRQAGAVALDVAFPTLRAPPEACARAFEQIAMKGAATVREVLLAAPQVERRSLELGLAWMAKYGFVDWLT